MKCALQLSQMSIAILFQLVNKTQTMSKPHHRTYGSIRQDNSLIQTIHNGFNYFHELDFKSRQLSEVKNHYRVKIPRTRTTASDHEDHRSLQMLLNQNKEQFARIKTELNSMREMQLNDYVKKSLKYQQILDINDNKKKRLPTLNTKVGQVIKKSAVEFGSKNIEYTITTLNFKLDGWRPESRQGHTTTVYRNLAVVIGGHCSSPFSNAQVFSLDNHIWTKSFQVPSARSYHSAILYKNRFIVVFGGMGTYDISRKCRGCFNSIYLIDLQSWTSRILKMNNEESVEGRRSHGAILMGKYMLIFGGINTKRQFLKDFIYLDLKELRWYHKEYKTQGKELSQYMESGLAKHKIISHFKPTHKRLPLYSSEYSDSEGLYFFGGIFGNGQESTLLYMGFNTYNPFLKRIEYAGLPPSFVDPIVEKMNDNIVIILSGEIRERNIKLYRIRERQFVGVFKFMTPSFFGGLGSTISKYNDEYFLFFGLAEHGYIGNVHSIKIEEKLLEGVAKKKKQRNLDSLQRGQQSLDSDSEASGL